MNGPFEHSSPEELTADRLRLYANGYHPVPANGKSQRGKSGKKVARQTTTQRQNSCRPISG